MIAHLLIPRSVEDGQYAESIAIFAARRCRTTKSHDELWEEVQAYSVEKRQSFLRRVVHEDWAADVLEMIHLVYDLEAVPLWLVIELLRHRLIARNFSIEQLSQRAIPSHKLAFEKSGNNALDTLMSEYIQQAGIIAVENKIAPETLRMAFPQGALVNLVIAANLRAFQHFFYMRCSPPVGKGGAHPKFMELADSMARQAAERLSSTMERVLQA